MANKNYTCGICLDEIESSMFILKFGLFSACEHVFCFACLKKWKKVKLGRVQCPECRLASELVVPSKRFLTGTEKNALIQQFRSHPSLESQCLVNRRPDPIKETWISWLAAEIAEQIIATLFIMVVHFLHLLLCLWHYINGTLSYWTIVDLMAISFISSLLSFFLRI